MGGTSSPKKAFPPPRWPVDEVSPRRWQAPRTATITSIFNEDDLVNGGTRATNGTNDTNKDTHTYEFVHTYPDITGEKDLLAGNGRRQGRNPPNRPNRGRQNPNAINVRRNPNRRRGRGQPNRGHGRQPPQPPPNPNNPQPPNPNPPQPPNPNPPQPPNPNLPQPPNPNPPQPPNPPGPPGMGANPAPGAPNQPTDPGLVAILNRLVQAQEKQASDKNESR